jgi:serine/threonine protein kinase
VEHLRLGGLATSVVNLAVESAVTASPGLSLSPTITTPAMTQAGLILGTAAYMSPEQARGKTVDRRTDIWAFGCVVYEMLTGLRAFDAEDVSLTLSIVLQRDPDFSALPTRVPAHVAHTLRLCLRKDPRQRPSDIRDVRLALDGAFHVDSPAAVTRRDAAPPAHRRVLCYVRKNRGDAELRRTVFGSPGAEATASHDCLAWRAGALMVSVVRPDARA